MKKLAVLPALLALFVFTGAAIAGPKGTPISFDMPNGGFCDGTQCVPASASFDGLIDLDTSDLSNLSGTLEIGSSPYSKTDRHLTINAPGPVTDGAFERPGFEQCVAGETAPYDWYDRVSWASTTVSLNAGSMKGSGRLSWNEWEFCVKIEVAPGEFKVEHGGFADSNLHGQLVGPKTAGDLFLNGPLPAIGP